MGVIKKSTWTSDQNDLLLSLLRYLVINLESVLFNTHNRFRECDVSH